MAYRGDQWTTAVKCDVKGMDSLASELVHVISRSLADDSLASASSPECRRHRGHRRRRRRRGAASCIRGILVQGPTGVGKSHMLEAISRHRPPGVQARTLKLAALYEKVTSHFHPPRRRRFLHDVCHPPSPDHGRCGGVTPTGFRRARGGRAGALYRGRPGERGAARARGCHDVSAPLPPLRAARRPAGSACPSSRSGRRAGGVESGAGAVPAWPA